MDMAKWSHLYTPADKWRIEGLVLKESGKKFDEYRKRCRFNHGISLIITEYHSYTWGITRIAFMVNVEKAGRGQDSYVTF